MLNYCGGGFVPGGLRCSERVLQRGLCDQNSKSQALCLDSGGAVISRGHGSVKVFSVKIKRRICISLNEGKTDCKD